MKLRIVSYVLSPGGGARFTTQLLAALQNSGALERPEFVSHGDTLAAYRKLFSQHGIACDFRDISPRGFREFSVPREALEDCDIAWFPWIHSHSIPLGMGDRVVGSFHDASAFTEESWIARYPAEARWARKGIGQWLASPATLVCSSRHWMDFLGEAFDCAENRLNLVALAADHLASPRTSEDTPGRWPFLASPYLLCPAGFSSHKNHRVLFEAYARAAIAWPLVLTGPGSEFVDRSMFLRRIARALAVAARLRPPAVSRMLRRMVRDLGIRGVMALGYLDDVAYAEILESAACVVMPTLSEGGGSFPVEEAVRRGIPVICSDIPVLREHMARIGASVSWFDPKEPAALVGCLREIVKDYPAAKQRALAQVAHLHGRQWSDVAGEYLSIFRAVAERAPAR